MRRFLASLTLLVMVAAVLAPVAHASVTKDPHACCFKRHHDTTTVTRVMSMDPAEQDCCGTAILHAAAPAPSPAAAAKPALSHPFLVEFYPSADSSDSATRQAQRAPPADSSRQ